MAKRVRKRPTLAELPPLPRLPSTRRIRRLRSTIRRPTKTTYLGDEYGIHSVSLMAPTSVTRLRYHLQPA